MTANQTAAHQVSQLKDVLMANFETRATKASGQLNLERERWTAEMTYRKEQAELDRKERAQEREDRLKKEADEREDRLKREERDFRLREAELNKRFEIEKMQLIESRAQREGAEKERSTLLNMVETMMKKFENK